MLMAKQKGSILTQSDYAEIRRVVREEVAEQIELRTSNLPTKKEFFDTSDKILAEIQGMRLDFAAHKSMHEDLEQEDKNILHKVKHLYKTFEIDEPANLLPAV
jgi:hypothetical protein